MNADQEPRNGPGSPTGPGASRDHVGSRSDEAELTDRLTAIADRRSPVPDWADVVRRAESPPVVASHGAGTGNRRGPFGRPMLAVAAALLLVIGGVGLVVATRGDDDESVESGPAGPDDPPVIDTGWYVPAPLPDGWEITSIEASTMTLVGPGTLAVWAAPDGSASLAYASEPLDGGIPMTGPRIQLTEEITGTVLDEQIYPGAVGWEDDDLLHLVIGNGLDGDDVEDAARLLATDPARIATPVAGMELITRSERTYTERESTEVTIELRTTEGRQVLYQLSPGDGFGRSLLLASIPVPRQVEGQPFEVLHLTALNDLIFDTTTYLGVWPGADVTLPIINDGYVLDGSQEAPTDGELEALLRSLRPATADQWRTFLRDTGLDVDPRLLEADRLVDLSDPVDPGANEDEPTEPQPQPGSSLDPGESPAPCDGFTTDFVDGYVFGTLAEAEAQAVADGMALRVVSIDGVDQVVTDDLRCDRVNVAVVGDRVVEVVGVG